MALREIIVPRRKVGWLSAKGKAHAVRESGPTIASMLEGLRAEGYGIAHGVQTSRGKVDHVVFGPTGTFAIETKSWTGKVSVVSGPRLMVGNHDEHASVRQLQGAAVDLQGRLSRAGVTPWVEAIIAVDRAELPRARMPLSSERVTVVRASELASLIRQHQGTLSDPEIDRARVALGA